MLKKCAWISILLAILLTAGVAQADLIEVYSNGDFEADLSLVPNTDDVTAASPTGWHYDDYYGYGVEPELMNVSRYGDGTGGSVGVIFPNWNRQQGWDAAITRFDAPVQAGQYTFTVILMGIYLKNNDNYLLGEIHWTNDPVDPWAPGNSDYMAGIGWVQLDPTHNSVWQTYSVDFEVLPGDPGVGQYFAPWIHVQNDWGNIILGEATLVRHNPDPGSGTIIVEKQTDPDGAPDTFTFSGDVAGSIKDGGLLTVSGLQPGTFTSQETVPADWNLTSIVCDDDNSSGNINTGTVIFQLEAEETVKCTFYNTQVEVEIDIKPGGYPNSINLKSKGRLPVAVITTDDFDASTVDPGTVSFADASPLRWTMDDVDGDRDMDLLFHFKTRELNLDQGSTEATLTGTTYGGQTIKGTDTVSIVPKGKGKGKKGKKRNR